MEITNISTPIGIATIKGDKNGVALVSIADVGVLSINIPSVLKDAVAQIEDYFNNRRTHFSFKLNPRGTDFQQKVWKELTTIPFGSTISYLELSKKLGDVKAVRAVAAANSKNPFMPKSA